MATNPTERLEELHKKLRAALSNRLTYPKTVIEVAGKRLLTHEEIQKACSYLDACLSILDAEMILFSEA